MMKTAKIMCVLMLCFGALWSGAAQADTLTFDLPNLFPNYSENVSQTFTGQDGYVTAGQYQGSADREFFRGGFMGLHDERGINGPFRDYATFLQVNVSSLTGLDITSATLSFDILDYSWDHGAGQTQVDLLFTSQNSSGTLGWQITPNANLGTVVDTFAEGVPSPGHQVDVTGLLTSRIDSGEDWFSLAMEALGTSAFEAAYTWTNNSSNSDPQPNAANVSLTVDYVGNWDQSLSPTSLPIPEPASLSLLVLGLAGVAARRFRKW